MNEQIINKEGNSEMSIKFFYLICILENNFKKKKKNLNHSIVKIFNKFKQIVKPNAKNLNKLHTKFKILNCNSKKLKNLKKNIFKQ